MDGSGPVFALLETESTEFEDIWVLTGILLCEGGRVGRSDGVGNDVGFGKDKHVAYRRYCPSLRVI